MYFNCTLKEFVTSLMVLLVLVLVFSNDTAWEPLETDGNWFIATGESGHSVPGEGEPSSDVFTFSTQAEKNHTEQGIVSVEFVNEESTDRQEKRTNTELFFYGVAATLIAVIFIASIVAFVFYRLSKE